MLVSRKANLKLKLAGPSTNAGSNDAPSTALAARASTRSVARSTNNTGLRSTSPRPPSSVYSQPSYPGPSSRNQGQYSHGTHLADIPSPISWTGSDDETTLQTHSTYGTESAYSYIPLALAQPAPVPPPSVPPVSHTSFPFRAPTNASQTAAARAFYSSPRPLASRLPGPRPLRTATRSTPYTADCTPPSYSIKGNMNCQGRYLRIGTLRGPTPSQMAWVDGVMMVAVEKAREKAEGKKGAQKAEKEMEKGVKQVRKWLREEKREVVEYTIEYMKWKYGADI